MSPARITVELRDGEDRVRQSFDGAAEVSAGTVRLRYEETGENGLDGSVEVAAGDGEMVIERRGAVSMRERLAAGLPTVFTYSTPYGETDIRVDTRRMRLEIKETRGRLWAEFYQRLGGEPVKKTLEIRYTLKGLTI